MKIVGFTVPRFVRKLLRHGVRFEVRLIRHLAGIGVMLSLLFGGCLFARKDLLGGGLPRPLSPLTMTVEARCGYGKAPRTKDSALKTMGM